MHRHALVLASLVVLALAGCVSTDNAAPVPVPSGAVAPSEAPEPQSEGAPFEVECSDIVSDQAIYDYNSNFGLADGFTPEPGSRAAEAVALGGTACAWQNETSGEMIVVAVANPSSAELATLKADAEFAITEGIGTAQAFSGYYWIIASSADFLEEGDAAPIVDSVITTLG